MTFNILFNEFLTTKWNISLFCIEEQKYTKMGIDHFKFLSSGGIYGLGRQTGFNKAYLIK